MLVKIGWIIRILFTRAGKQSAGGLDALHIHRSTVPMTESLGGERDLPCRQDEAVSLNCAIPTGAYCEAVDESKRAPPSFPFLNA